MSTARSYKLTKTTSKLFIHEGITTNTFGTYENYRNYIMFKSSLSFKPFNRWNHEPKGVNVVGNEVGLSFELCVIE